MKDSKTFWDKAAPRYAKSPIRDEATYQEKLAITQRYLRPDWRVLEFGCGTGGTAIAHSPYVTDIFAIDISPEMIRIAKTKIGDAGIENITFQEGTLDDLELETESFDAVLGLNILHLLKDVDDAIDQVNTLLKPGGVFVSSTALVGELKWYFRLAIPVMQLVGLAPHVSQLTQRGLISQLTRSGFEIDYEWQPRRDAIFIVAKKLT